MPQLVPFYFVNQVSFAFVIFFLLIYVFSRYVLPRLLRLFIARTYVSKV